MSVETPEELAGLIAAGGVVADALRAMRRAARPGVSTAELDAVAARVLRRAGARSGPRLDYGFPGVTCISVNDEAVHGIPGRRRLREGDLAKLDVTVELDGFYADACVPVSIGRSPRATGQLVQSARRALARALEIARPGTPLHEIGSVIEQTVRERGHRVCGELSGHGIGRRIHEPPEVPNRFDPRLTQRLTDGLVMTIEPIVSAGSGAVRVGRDGWTIRTADGALSAHVEHTIVVRDGAPLILTA